jgi:hypothetical protein
MRLLILRVQHGSGGQDYADAPAAVQVAGDQHPAVALRRRRPNLVLRARFWTRSSSGARAGHHERIWALEAVNLGTIRVYRR